jgi:hypothetical protein
MKAFATLLLALAMSGRAQTNPDVIRKAESAGAQLQVGNGLCFVSMWGFIPFVYDAGLLTMMSARGTLATQYQEKFHEAPPKFGESGESAYLTGWLLKGGAVAGLYLAAQEKSLLGFIAFPILWLAGTVKHYEAQRLMYDDGMNRKNLILDKNETRSEPQGMELRLALPYSF